MLSDTNLFVMGLVTVIFIIAVVYMVMRDSAAPRNSDQMDELKSKLESSRRRVG